MKTQQNPLTRLLSASREAYLVQREAAARARRICQPGDTTQRARKARRAPLVSLPGHPAPIAYQPAPPAPPPVVDLQPLAVPPAPTIAKPARQAKAKPAPGSITAYANPRAKISRAGCRIDVPTAEAVANRAKHCADVTTNDDGQISSPELTAWYVAAVCSLNHYR